MRRSEPCIESSWYIRHGGSELLSNGRADCHGHDSGSLATTHEGRAHYRRRKTIPEPVFGWIKQVLGFRSFSLRGFAAASGEWRLICMAVNLKRMHRLSWTPA